MERTTVMIPAGLKDRIELEAKRRGISMGSFIRHSLEQELNRRVPLSKNDSFFGDQQVFSGKVPGKDSLKFDDVIYGEDF